MNMRTETAPRTIRKGNPEISYAIGLLTSFANLIDRSTSGGQESYDEHMAIVTALKFTQAEIEEPLQARIKALEGSARTSAEEVITLRALNAEMLGMLHRITNELEQWDVENDLIPTARAIIAKSAQPTIIHLPADDTEGGAL